MSAADTPYGLCQVHRHCRRHSRAATAESDGSRERKRREKKDHKKEKKEKKEKHKKASRGATCRRSDSRNALCLAAGCCACGP